MDSTNSLTVCEVNGKSRSELEELPRCEIRSHWNDNDLVVVQILNQVVTLRAREIIAAVSNSTNIPR
jgi:hypothetical protein